MDEASELVCHRRKQLRNQLRPALSGSQREYGGINTATFAIKDVEGHPRRLCIRIEKSHPCVEPGAFGDVGKVQVRKTSALGLDSGKENAIRRSKIRITNEATGVALHLEVEGTDDQSVSGQAEQLFNAFL